MEGKRVIQSISLRNLLSYGSEGHLLELQPLNVIIGPNGSGKSNFIEIFRLLNAMSHDMSKVSVSAGGIQDWLWKGSIAPAEAQVETILSATATFSYEHQLTFGEAAGKQRILDESISLCDNAASSNMENLYLFNNDNIKIA